MAFIFAVYFINGYLKYMIMKKILLLLITSVFTLSVYSQDTDTDSYYNGLETYGDLRLTSDQVAKIKKLKREVGPKFQAIGKDRSLSGYEKGQRKRELAQKHRQEIESILTGSQISEWESKHGKYNSWNDAKDRISDNYDDRLDMLEKQYEREKDRIEDNYTLSKKEQKAQKEALKDRYKADKNRLKKEKDRAKRGY